MKQQRSDHPTSTELNLLLDGELAPERALIVRRHLSACASCASRCAELEQVCAQVRGAAPEPAECCAEGAFWVRLAGHLGEPQARTTAPDKRSWLGLLPSFALAAVGSLVDILLTAVLLGYAAVKLGVLPDLGAQLAAILQAAVPGYSGALGSWLSGLAETGVAGNELALFLALTALSFILTMVVALLLLWSVPHVAEQQGSPKVRAHAAR